MQIIEQGDPWGRIGVGLGKGFGEGVSSQIERNMLAKGLETLSRGKESTNPETGEKTYTPYNQLELLSKGYRLPGFAEHAGTFLPALENAAYRKSLEDQARAEKSIVANKPAAVQEEKKPVEKMPAKEMAPGRQGVGFATPEERQERKKTLAREFTPSEIAAEKLRVAQSGLTDRNEINRIALENLKGPGLAAAANEAAAAQKFETRINNLLGADVQPGIRDALREELAHRTRQEDKTPDEAVGEMIPIIEDIAKAKTQIQNTAGSFITRLANQEGKFRAYKEQQKIFDKYGLREQFLDLVKAEQGLTNIQAAQDFDPLENQKIKGIIKSLPDNKGSTVVRKLDEKKMNQILDAITPADNLLSIAGELRDKYYSVPQFMEEAGRLDDLEKEQQRQLQKPENNSMIGDLFWRAFR